MSQEGETRGSRTNSVPDGLEQALVRVADDPVEFESFVAEIMAATRRADQFVAGDFELAVRQSLPSPANTRISRQQTIGAYLELLGEPAVAVEDSGTVIHINNRAQILFGVGPNDSLSALGIDRSAFERLIARMRAGADRAPFLVCGPSGVERPRMWLGKVLPASGVMCLSPVTSFWPEGLDAVLTGEFQLSPREILVLRALMEGHAADRIATDQGKALGTIRQTIKSILSKLSVGSQVQAVALVSAMLVGLVPDRAISAPPVVDIKYQSCHDRFGRMVGFRRYGMAGGAPILFCHGTLFGIGELDAERRIARELGLEILACERPGYGRTPPCKVRNDLIQTAVDDMSLVLDTEGIERVVMLTHDTGFAFATALAARSVGRIAGIVAVSPVVPMRSSDQSSAMPAQQQVFAWAARHAPWLVDVLTRIGVERMRKVGAAGWPHAVFAGAEADMATLSRPELLGAFRSAYGYNIAQAALGFRYDVGIANADWTAEFEQLHLPVHLLHGDRNMTVPAGAVARFAEHHDNVSLERIAAAGHTLAYSDPHLGLRAAFAMAVRSGLC